MRISDWSSDVCSSDLAPRRAGIDDAPGGHAGIVRRRPVEGAVARLRSGRPLLHLERLLAGGTEGLAAAKQQAADRGSEGAGPASARSHRTPSRLLCTSNTLPVVPRVPLR